MKATITKPETWKRMIDVEIPHEEVESVYQEKLGRYRRDLALPGFRPGKVPTAIVQSRFGDAIRADVIEGLIQKSYEDACKEHQIVPVSRAVVRDLKAEVGAPVSFAIETEVDPEIEIRGYDKLKIKAEPNKIKPAQVDEVIKDLRERVATYTDVERTAGKGDFVRIEYLKVEIDGLERTDVSSPKYPLELGENKVKEFDRALIGSKAGEEIDVAIRFPKDYADADIAGKPANFKVKVLKVQERSLPEIDREFLDKVGEFKDEADLRAKVQQDLEEREMERAKNEAYGRVIDELIRKNPFDVPPARVASYMDYVAEDMKKYARPGEQLPSREETEQRYTETAIKTLKRFRIISYVAAREKIKATQEEVDRQIRIMAERYRQPFDELKKRLREDGTAIRIREDIRERKTMDYLIGEFSPEKAEEKI